MDSSDCNPVLCMQHCTNQLNIFFTNFPKACPICKKPLDNCSLLIPPFRLPTPFVSHRVSPCCLLVRPTSGTFLRDYRNGDYLHVGITSSDGHVYNYDESGLHCDLDGWEQCVAVDISNRITHDKKLWDSYLQDMLFSGVWSTKRYSADENNCYDFVLSFLNQHGRINGEAMTRQDFCRNYVVAATTKAAKYIHLYRKIQDSSTAVEKICTQL